MGDFHCTACRHRAKTWIKRCPGCGRFNSFSTHAGGIIVKSTDEAAPEHVRTPTGVGVLDRVLLGGIVRPSAIILAGIAGAGKTTMILQALAGLAAQGIRCGYLSAEEEPQNLILLARRVGAVHDRVDFIRADDFDAAMQAAAAYDVAVYDSIQKLRIDADAITMPKTRIMISQLNAEGVIKGERANEHNPDVLLFCDYDPSTGERFLESTKNRHGKLEKHSYLLTDIGVESEPPPKKRTVRAKAADSSTVTVDVFDRDPSPTPKGTRPS